MSATTGLMTDPTPSTWILDLASGDRVGVAVTSLEPDSVICSVQFLLDDADAAGGPRSVLLTLDETDQLVVRLLEAARLVSDR